jgi:hypothetical protein
MIPFAGAAATGGKLIKKGVQALGPVVAPVVKNIVKNVAPAVAPAAKKVISTVASVAAPIAKKAISTATTAVKNTAAAAISSVKNAASNFASGVKGLVGGLFKKSAPASEVAKKPIVIGENMKRVKQYAESIGGHAYKPWKNDPFDYDLAMKRNQRWINDMKRDAREIIDIGPDFKRREVRGASDFYEMERSQLKGYKNYTKAFTRSGKTGGVLELDY